MAAVDKGAFKSGCESGGHSFVENADGSFQCNLKSGGVIKCGSQTCTYTASFGSDTGIVVSQRRPGIGELLTLSSGSATGIMVGLTTAGVKELLTLRSRKDSDLLSEV